MNKKLALQLKKFGYSTLLLLLLTGYLLQLTGRVPQTEIRIESEVFADNGGEALSTKTEKISHKKINEKDIYAAIENMDIDRKKVQSVQTFLGRRGSPLAAKAEYIVKSAEIFGIDYRLVPAISIVESSGGKKTYRRFNAWGWGGSKGYSFSSWEEGIYTVSKGLSKYYASGATTPIAIAPRYNPHTPQEWAGKVQFLMNQM